MDTLKKLGYETVKSEEPERIIELAGSIKDESEGSIAIRGFFVCENSFILILFLKGFKEYGRQIWCI